MMEPVISPSSSSFQESLSISITQAQGYDIYYRLNSGTPQLYSGSFDIAQTTSLTAYAKTILDGRIVLSKEVSATYTMCASSEDLIGGSCVEHEDPIMPTPTATPMEPEFTDSVEVSLTSPEGGVIFYIVDSGDDWLVYSSPITLTDSATIYAYADSDPYDLDAIYSEIAVFSYSKVDDAVDPGNGRWVLYDKVFINGCATFDNSSYSPYWHLTCGASEGSYSAETVHGDKTGSAGTGSYTIAPSTLIPGESYTFNVTFSGSGWAYVYVGFYSTYIGLSFSEDGTPTFSAQWWNLIASSSSSYVSGSESYTVPVDLNKEGVLAISTGATMGNSVYNMAYISLYKWQK